MTAHLCVTAEQKRFLKTFFKVAVFIIFQNMITYSVNVADNIMLGSYSQNALAGAATVNQIQFLFQQVTFGLGEGVVALAAQYWGGKNTKPIYIFAWIGLTIGIGIGFFLTLGASLFPDKILHIFTSDPMIISEGVAYLNIMRFTYIPFMITGILICSLRSMEMVKIGFYVSMLSLLINITLNSIFIFGRFGMPEMGTAGAAVGTLSARIAELVTIIVYIRKKKPGLLVPQFFNFKAQHFITFVKTSLPIVTAQTLFGLSLTLQTVILGHLSSIAIAANSAATTIFQYLKLIAVGSSSATVIVVGKLVGSGKDASLEKHKKDLQKIYLLVGLLICLLLNVIKNPLLSVYSLTADTKQLAIQIITVLSICSIGMAYQMPVIAGIIRGAGDTSFGLKCDTVCIWAIMYPLSLLAAFVWKVPVLMIVAFLNSDQIFKCIPAFIKVNKYFKVQQIIDKVASKSPEHSGRLFTNQGGND